MPCKSPRLTYSKYKHVCANTIGVVMVSSYGPKFAALRLFVETMPIYNAVATGNKNNELYRERHVHEITLDRHNATLQPNNYLHPDPSQFSLPSTFKIVAPYCTHSTHITRDTHIHWLEAAVCGIIQWNLRIWMDKAPLNHSLSFIRLLFSFCRGIYALLACPTAYVIHHSLFLPPSHPPPPFLLIPSLSLSLSISGSYILLNPLCSPSNSAGKAVELPM
jgi:hypothetical protein